MKKKRNKNKNAFEEKEKSDQTEDVVSEEFIFERETRNDGNTFFFGRRSNFWAILLLAHTSLWLHADQNLRAPNLTAIAEDFGMTEAERDQKLGGEVSLCFCVVGGIVALSIGPLSDTRNRINLYTLVVWLGAFPCLLMVFVKRYWQFLLLRILTGVSMGGALPIIFSLASDFFPPSQRSLIAAAITFLHGIGGAIGSLIAGEVGPVYGWRLPFLICAIPPVISAVFVRIFVKEPPRGRFGHTDLFHTNKLTWRKFVAVFRIRTNCFIFIQGLFGCVPWSIISTYLADFLHEDKGLTVQHAVVILTCFSAGCLCNLIFGGVVGQYVYNRRKGSEAILMSVTTALGMIPFYILINKSYGSKEDFANYVIGFCGGIASVTGPNIRAVIMNVNPPNNQGTMFSIYTISDDLGAGFGPVIAAGLIGFMGRLKAFNVGFGCWGVCSVLISFMLCSIPQDEQKLATRTAEIAQRRNSLTIAEEDTKDMVESKSQMAEEEKQPSNKTIPKEGVSIMTDQQLV